MYLDNSKHPVNSTGLEHQNMYLVNVSPSLINI